MELKLAEKMMEDVEKTEPQLSTYDVKEHHFEVNETILTKLKTEKSLGTLTQKTLNKECHPVQIKSRQSSHEGEICLKTSKDEFRCWITGMTLLTPDLLIINGHNNNAVMKVDTSSKSVSDQLQLGDKPWDITRVINAELAVTLPYKQTIQFISISSNKLIKKHTMTVDGDCCGISCYQGKPVVSLRYPAKLQILDINGTILTTIDGRNIFKDPYYVISNRSSIYVSDWDMNTVSRLNWKGEVIGNHNGMSAPRGMSLSADGTVFLCNWARNVIEEISGDCSTGKVVLQDLNTTVTLSWCGETKKLYYSCYNSDEKKDNFLYIYKLS
jgi:hypothetical protein